MWVKHQTETKMVKSLKGNSYKEQINSRNFFQLRDEETEGGSHHTLQLPLKARGDDDLLFNDQKQNLRK